MGDHNEINVLMLMPSAATRFAIGTLAEEIATKYRFFFQDLKPSSTAAFPSLQDYLDDARETVVQKKIDIVLSYTSESGAFLKAALAQQFPHLQGPSVESVFLAHHKFYCRCFLDPQPIPFASLDLCAPDLDRACEEALKAVDTPAFFKPTTLSGSRGISGIRDITELKEFTKTYIYSDDYSMEKLDAKFVAPFYVRNIDVEKYPLAIQSTAIIEKHMGDVARVNVDGYVYKGAIFHWSLSDNLYSQSQPLYYFGAALPSKLSESMQLKVWDAFDAVVSKMINFGYDNEFVNVEFFVLDSGEIKLMEINPRRGGSMKTSEMVFTNGDVTVAQLKLAQGENPGVPVPNGQHALSGYIRTCGSGKASEFYDYSCTDPGLMPQVDPSDFIDAPEEPGILLCKTIVSGDSREEVLEKYRVICSCVLLQPELSVCLTTRHK